MRTLLKFFAVLLVLITLLVGSLAALAIGYYESYLKPVPADFEFSRPIESITEIGLIKVKIVSDEEINLVPIATVIDTEGFISDLSELSCMKGLSLDGIAKLGELTEVDAIKINYSDGTYEVITAYGNLNSEIFSENITPEDIFYGDYYIFGEAEFSELLDKYSVK